MNAIFIVDVKLWFKSTGIYKCCTISHGRWVHKQVGWYLNREHESLELETPVWQRKIKNESENLMQKLEP